MPTLHTDAVNRWIAAGTFSVNDIFFHNLVSVPFDEQFFTMVTIGVSSFFAGDVAFVDVAQSCFQADFPRPSEGVNRCRRFFDEPVLRIKAAYMPGYFRTDVLDKTGNLS